MPARATPTSAPTSSARSWASPPTRPRGDPRVLLACNLDDLSPELVPDAAQACTDAGALDVWIAPVQMKKGRPGMVLSAIARPDREAAVAEAMLRATSTLGVRTSRCTATSSTARCGPSPSRAARSP